jgi:hypothetical protein
MTSKPVYTSTAEGFRDAKEIAGLRAIPEARPRAPRKAPVKRAVSSGIVCFCGERFAESQALEFMLHLRAEVGEVLEWRERFLTQNRLAVRRYRDENIERVREQRERQSRLSQDPEWRKRKAEAERQRYARKKAEQGGL